MKLTANRKKPQLKRTVLISKLCYGILLI